MFPEGGNNIQGFCHIAIVYKNIARVVLIRPCSSVRGRLEPPRTTQ